MKTIRQVTLISASICLVWSAIYLIEPVAAETMFGQSLTFASRVDYERKVQAVFHGRRTQPQENAAPKPSLEAVLPVEASEAKVTDVLRKSNALEQFGNVTITPEMLQAEINRMNRETRQPEVLREIYAALDNNPYIIAEVVARPNLVERLTNNQRADFDDWWTKERGNFSIEITRQDFNYSLPEISAGGNLSDDTWKPLPTLPEGSTEHTIVWTGAEMLVWGGVIPASGASRTNAGSRYNLATDSWSPITGSGAPFARRTHTAVWTGTEMIVWGGCGGIHFCGLDSGGRYNPATDSWLPTSATNVPNPRLDHTAIWTGDRMIVFGGCDPNYSFTSCPSRRDGGMYFPATDSWVAIPDATSIRTEHTAVWTGTEMLVWGGLSNVGERFNPNTNSWTTMNAANAPESRDRQTAVWTGTEMIVWGGQSFNTTFNTGGRYNPTSDSWTPTNTANAPEARYLHTGIWTGTEMIIWGGNTATLGENFLNTGAKYNPANDSWTSINTATAPLPRENHKAVWTGSEMIIWGGRNYASSSKTGSRYDPATDSWIVTNTNDSASNPDAEAVWTGAEMIIWGGANINRGTKYNPATSVWSPIANPTGLGQRDRGFKLIWTGTEMIVWGGQTGNWGFDTGGRYNPATDTWTLTAMANAPIERSYHTAVWTGSEMIIWGGSGEEGLLNNGGRYNPSTNAWLPVSTTGAPQARYLHTAVFVGGKMVVWSGSGGSGFLNTGGRYEPSTNSWQPVSTVNAPAGRMNHTAISTGTEMIVWGGHQFQLGPPFHNTGGRYDPATDVWAPTSLTNAPVPRAFHTAVWTGTEMIVWGGNITDSFVGSNTGGRYDPATNSWRATSIFGAGAERSDHVAVWTGGNMIIWGGNVRAGSARAGYEYFANANAPTMFDFDGDGKADQAVFRPTDHVWYLLRSSSGFTSAQFGLSTDKITPADFDGDGKTDIAVFRDGVWYWLNSSNGAVNVVQFGIAGDIPVPADYTGDGRDELAVYRGGVWWTLNLANGQSQTVQFGISSDKPVPADFDGDGKIDYAVYRDGIWHYLGSSDNGYRIVQFGIASDRPVVADYDGDKKTDYAVFRQGVWYVWESTTDSLRVFQWGIAGDVPVPADYDGDKKTDFAVYRQGVWYIWHSSTNDYTATYFGLATDIPIPSAYSR